MAYVEEAYGTDGALIETRTWADDGMFTRRAPNGTVLEQRPQNPVDTKAVTAYGEATHLGADLTAVLAMVTTLQANANAGPPTLLNLSYSVDLNRRVNDLTNAVLALIDVVSQKPAPPAPPRAPGGGLLGII